MSDIPDTGVFPSAERAAARTRAPRIDDPVLLPGLTPGLLLDRVAAITMRERAFLWWYLALGPVVILLTMLIVGLTWTFVRGPGVWGLNWPVMWGFAIINYVWWIGIGCGALFISSVLHVTGAPWRAGISRLADCIALFAGAAGGIFPIVHLGRPWLFYWLFPYPNTMGYWPNWRSPLLWDFWGIISFLIVAASYWYLGLIPDFASLRDRAATRGFRMIYGILALGFDGSMRQWRHYQAAYGLLGVVALLAACNTHSIAALDFAGAATVGWHSTQMPPYFVFGAVLSGAATILLIGLPLRHVLRLGDVMTGRHIDMLGRIMIAASLLLCYSYAIEAFMSWYGADPAERTRFADSAMGAYWYIYWGTILFNVVLPQFLWLAWVRMSRLCLMVISFFVLVGMWMDPYKLIVASLFRPRLPSAWGWYHGSWFDWLLLLGSIGFFFLLLLMAIRLLPIVNLAGVRSVIAGRRT